MYNDILGPGSDEDFDHYKISSESGGVVMDQ